ncbi:MAG: A/G-specific adenine glycosylase [Candidatus Sericytochromatia bacterium]|nr:A/G-specific adenine glycosylase [Candidatus Sericytochromatia bacterium]
MYGLEQLGTDLLAWFDEHQIVLPWRGMGDPYAIWVSEIMLQQTQVKTVIPYFERWMTLFPSLKALAAAPQDAVMKAWEGLGYYSRARHLLAAAQIVVEHYEGQIPRHWTALRRLPGVGDYTAGAILSMAYDQRVPAVDGNALRVFSRLALIREDVSRSLGKRLITSVIQDAMGHISRPGDFNQAVMDLGRDVCVPQRPNCGVCPVRQHCRAHAAGEERLLPVKPGTRPPRDLVLAAALVEREGRFLLVKRRSVGIWGGMWSLPTVELPSLLVTDSETCQTAAAREWGLAGWPFQLGAAVVTLKHQLTHRSLTIPVFEAVLPGMPPAGFEFSWVGPDEWSSVPLPVPFARLLDRLDAGPLFRQAAHDGCVRPFRLL